MSINPNKQVWQFPVQNNRSRFADEGVTYFKARSTEKAIMLGCRLMTTQDVKLERVHNNAWKVTGTVLLHSPTTDNTLTHPSSNLAPRSGTA
jgi:hypothetical protein